MDSMVEQIKNCNIYNFELCDKWTLWAHLPYDKTWDLDSYKQISDITSFEDAITLFENLPEIIIKNGMLFLMRKGISPMWEDPQNKDGGCFSYTINQNIVVNVWKKISYILVGETLTNEKYSKNITGITISPKKNFCIIKVWLTNCEEHELNKIIDIDGLSNQECIFKKHIGN